MPEDAEAYTTVQTIKDITGDGSVPSGHPHARQRYWKMVFWESEARCLYQNSARQESIKKFQQ